MHLSIKIDYSKIHLSLNNAPLNKLLKNISLVQKNAPLHNFFFFFTFSLHLLRKILVHAVLFKIIWQGIIRARHTHALWAFP